MVNFLIFLFCIIGAPILGGLLTGLDRRLTARLQNRMGPPILQPFYDFFKLIGKEHITVNQTQIVYAIAHLFFAVVSLTMLVLGLDLLMTLFILAFSSLSLILGAMSVRSPYSKVGAQRELMQMMAYEPVLILAVIGIYKVTGTFMVQGIFDYGKPLLYELPLIFFALLYVLTIKLRKSPFDFSTSHHGHQELIKGITTEFSGPQLALIELTHWFDTVFILGFVAIFFANPLWVGILIAFVAFLLEILIDNISARVYWKWMIKMTWLVGITIAMANIFWLYYK